MSLSPAQLQTIKADLAANVATVSVNGGPATAINAVGHDPDSADAVAKWYNQAAAGPYYVIRTDAPVVDILNNIQGANYTPADAVTSGNAAQATAASNYCMAKQQNLIMLGITRSGGSSTFDASKATNAATLKDATTKLPSATGFANQTGGWPNVIPVLQRACTNAEKLFAVASTVPALQNAASARGTQYDGTNGNPDVLTFQGSLMAGDILNAWNS